MARDMHADVVTDLSSSSLIVAPLVDLFFDSTTISFTTMPYNIEVGSTTYIGVGNLGEIDTVQESTSIQGLSLNITLSGINPSIIPVALREDYQGRRATISILFLEKDFSQIGEPVLTFDGLMDYMNINYGRDSFITLTLESKFAEWERNKTKRYNSVDQRDRYPTDKGLDFVEEIEQKDIPWGV